jgi:hypothetical protein
MPNPPTKPTSSEALQFEERLKQLQAEAAEARLDAEKSYYRMRTVWARALFGVLAFTIIFQYLLTVLVGLGWLHFESYQTFLNIVAGESFIQVIGLCAIVVSFLFPRIGDK